MSADDGGGLWGLVNNRWLSLVCGMFIMSVSGTQYIFGVYSPDLKDTMGYSQKETQLVGTMGNFGVYLGVLPGLFLDFFGARLTCVIAAVLMFTGYMLMYLAVIKAFPTEYYVMALFMIIQGNGSAAAYTSSLAANIPKFAEVHRAKVVGVLVCFFGLSSAIFTQLYDLLFKGDVESLFLFLAISLSAVTCTGIVFLSPHRAPKRDLDMIADEVFEEHELKEKVAIKEVLASAHFYDRQLNSLQMMATLEFWLLAATFLLSAGAGLTVINNMGSLTLSLGGKNGDQDLIVTVISVANALGRFISGGLADALQRWVSRSAVLCVNVLLIACACVYLAFVPEGDVDLLYPGAVLLGLAYGGMFCMTPTLCHALFGELNFGANFNVFGLCPAFGSLLFATGVAGYVYDNHTDSAESSANCYGTECYRATLLIVGGMAVLGAVTAAALGVHLSEWRARRHAAIHEPINDGSGTAYGDLYADM